ncbi:AraC family transcriptional regulator [Dactylosporangium vinaceum]|uniref:Helix-turn-helix transcriptional regulator n=1 Tax=Dactylosporangium vinaceum TaxID=53362 RepID=A0ABV5MEG4_9ACTN|nr:helix-turn-helix transcriptional regulator [Dactylosporangium vinaceum]UAB92417.1 AraC family transcriptional regulator [Dactylosporangium vinaceum]
MRVERMAMSTRDADEATHVIEKMYVGHRSRFTARQSPPELALTSATAGPLRVDRLRNSFRFVTDGDPFDYICAQQLLRGEMTLRTGREEVRQRPGDGFLHLLGADSHATLADFDVAVLCLPLARVAAAAAVHTDIDACDLRFESPTPVSPALRRYWTHVLAYVHRTLMDRDTQVLPPLVAEQVADTAATALLAVFPNTTMTTHHSAPTSPLHPAALRRAVSFMEDHAGDPITVSDIAAAAGITPRALQQGFARHHDTTPMAYLRRTRLERAHRDLQAADPTTGATVAAIAGRWGFAKAGNFATVYRRAYGRPPSRTLRT